MSRKIAIIGAGPIGLEAALAAKQQGFDATIYESGEVADSVKRWGHVKMFSPFAMNASPSGRALLMEQGRTLPAENACLTGADFAAAYLDPLSKHFRVLTQTKVKAIVRDGAGKRDKIGEDGRADTPFRLLVEHDGVERHERADIIFDCSGTFQNPNPLGDSGAPAPGEFAAREFILHGVGAMADIQTFAGWRILVAGGGHSAANIIVALASLKELHPTTEIHWIVKRAGDIPCPRAANDPLPERDFICAAANAASASGQVVLHAGSTVMGLAKKSEALEITLQNSGGTKVIEVDRAIAATGFRPDWSFSRELHIQTCWATEGTYPLAASLLGESGGDCLAVPAFGADTLRHPEPHFYALGMKSYGRTPDFLIATGLQQIESIMERLVADGKQG